MFCSHLGWDWVQIGDPKAWSSLPQDSPIPLVLLNSSEASEEVKLRVLSPHKNTLANTCSALNAVKCPYLAGHSKGKPQTCNPNSSHMTSAGCLSLGPKFSPRKFVKEVHHPGLLWGANKTAMSGTSKHQVGSCLLPHPGLVSPSPSRARLESIRRQF